MPKTYAAFKEYWDEFFPQKKDEIDYSLPPEEFGKLLAKEFGEEIRVAIHEFLEKVKKERVKADMPSINEQINSINAYFKDVGSSDRVVILTESEAE